MIQRIKKLSRDTTFKFIILLGILSLFSDMVYEGSRSVVGPFFALLGASGTVVGFIAGLGELVGNVLRIASGYFIDRTKKYWPITFCGYACLLAIPFLSLATTWKIAAALLILERIGKAIRTPARDAMLSYAAQKLGRGTGFGLHQVFDQVGGMLGPFIMALVLLSHNSYQFGFFILLFPACATFVVLYLGKRSYPNPQNLEIAPTEIISGTISASPPKAFWIYLIAACLLAAGYADFPLIAFHFEKQNIVQPIAIPIFFILAMGVSAASALLFGWIYDRAGLLSFFIAIPISAFYAPCVFLNSFTTALLGMMLWGIGMGAQRSLLKAVVGDMITKQTRAAAYGIFNAGYGVAWFLGSWLMGVLYDTSLHYLIIFSITAELAALPFIVWIVRAL